MKIVVLGSTGFIGRAVVARLTITKHIVRPYTRRTADLLDAAVLATALRRDRPDVIVNCAAHTGSGQYVNAHAAEVFADNAQMALNLYRALQHASPHTRIINLISNCSYPGDKGLQREEEWEDGPVHDSIAAYGNARRMLYYTALAFATQHGTRSSNLILPEVYGPGDHTDPARTHATDGMVIRLFQAKRAGAKKFVIWGTGAPIRETIFVRDVAEAVARALAMKQDILYPVNIGQGKGRSILQTARVIRDAMDFGGKLVMDTSRQDGAPKKVLSPGRFKRIFPDFRFTDFKTGIRETVLYYKGALAAGSHYRHDAHRTSR